MIQLLDLHSLASLQAVASAIFGFSLVACWRMRRENWAALLWGIALLLQFVRAMLLVLVVDRTQVWFSYTINIPGFLGGACLLAGSLQFAGQSRVVPYALLTGPVIWLIHWAVLASSGHAVAELAARFGGGFQLLAAAAAMVLAWARLRDLASFIAACATAAWSVLIATFMTGIDPGALGPIIPLARTTLLLVMAGALLLVANRQNALAFQDTRSRAIQAQARAIQFDRLFSEVLDHMPSAVWLTRNDHIVVANNTLASWLGLSKEALVGLSRRQLRELSGVPEDRRLQPGVNQVGQFKMMPAGGVERDLLVAVFTIENSTEGEAEIGFVATDISDLRQLERQLSQGQKNEALGRLAGGIAHDFNNILGTIQGFADFIAQDAEEDSKTHGYARRILAASARARDLVQQILLYSQQRNIAEQDVALHRVVADAVGYARQSLPDTIDLRLEQLADPIVRGDPTQIGQVVVNLCSNARDAMGETSGQISVSLREIEGAELADAWGGTQGVRDVTDGWIYRQDGELDRRRRYAEITVRDNGSGISRKTLERIYEPFFTTKAQGRGTGLGLPVVQGVTTAHQGVLSIHSKAGEGSSFRIWLPVKVADADPVAAPSGSVSAEANRNVLIIDDDAGFADMVATALERDGMAPMVVTDAIEGLSIINQSAALWDVIVVDQMMPGVTGLELINRVKAIRPDIRTVLCSGYASRLTPDSVRNAGIDAFLAKPLDPKLLASVVRKLLGSRA